MADQTATSANTKRLAFPPILGIAFGTIICGIFIAGLAVDIQASESFFLGGKLAGLALNWSIFLQPIQLLEGLLTPKEAVAVIWGFGIEAIFVACMFRLEQTFSGLRNTHRNFPKVFGTLAAILIILNGIADYMYYGGDFLRGLAFALIMFVVVGFFCLIGVALIEHGIRDIAH